MGLFDKLTNDRSDKDTFRPSTEHAGSSQPLPPAYPSEPAPLTMPPAPPVANGRPMATFACLHLARSDRVRLLGFPDSVIPAVGEAIGRVWMSGIQRQEAYQYGGYEWKLSGNPCKLAFHRKDQIAGESIYGITMLKGRVRQWPRSRAIS